MSGIVDTVDMVGGTQILHTLCFGRMLTHLAALGEQPAHGVGHNVPPTTEQANTTHSTSTNYGPHSTNIGNKLDPRFDSDTDHRGTATTSTNAGPHSTNIGNKLDPTVDSDMDHRANPTSGIGPNTTHPAGGFDSTNAGPHRSNFANKIDPRVDSDHDHRMNQGPQLGGGPQY